MYLEKAFQIEEKAIVKNTEIGTYIVCSKNRKEAQL